MIEAINSIPEPELCGIATVIGLLIAGLIAIDARSGK